MGEVHKRALVDYLRGPTFERFINMTRGGLGVREVERYLGGRLEVPIESRQDAQIFHEVCVKWDLRWLTLLTMKSLMGYISNRSHITVKEDEYLYNERPVYPNTQEIYQLKEIFLTLEQNRERVGLTVEEQPEMIAYGSLEFIMNLLLGDGSQNKDYLTLQDNHYLIKSIDEWGGFSLVDTYILRSFSRYLTLQYWGIYGYKVNKLPIYNVINNQLAQAKQHIEFRESLNLTTRSPLTLFKKACQDGSIRGIKKNVSNCLPNQTQ